MSNQYSIFVLAYTKYKYDTIPKNQYEMKNKKFPVGFSYYKNYDVVDACP